MLFHTNYLFSLPEELWIYILKNVSSQDAFNVFREFPHISKAVQQYKAQLLFGKVVPFLCDWEHSKEQGNPGAGGLLTLDDILSCRLVCKNWSSEIDLMFTTQDQYNIEESSPESLVCSDWACSFEIQFKKVTQFAKFSQQFANSPRNPFPARTFTLFFESLWEFDPSEEDEQSTNERYWNLLIDFLQTFGKHIWHLKLTPGINQEGYLEVNGPTRLQTFAKCLHLLPNLKFLNLRPFGEKWLLNSNDVVTPPLGPSNLEIAVLTLPDLDGLFFDWFFRGFCQSLREVEFELSQVRYISSPEHLTFPALFSVAVSKANSSEIVEHLSKWVMPNLRKLNISFSPDEIPKLKPEIIQALENFPNRELFEFDSDEEEDNFVSLSYKVD